MMRLPSHGIAGVRQARPPYYKFSEPAERGRVQASWEQFIRTNPSHRPGSAGRDLDHACIVHRVGDLHQTKPCSGRCLDPDSYSELSRYRDHSEPWHCKVEGRKRPVIFGHSYEVFQDVRKLCVDKITQFLHQLPEGAGDRLAVYVGSDPESWYTIPLNGVLIQHQDLPPISGWLRITTSGSRMVPPLRVAH